MLKGCPGPYSLVPAPLSGSVSKFVRIGWGDSNSTTAVSSVRGQGAVGPETCGSWERLLTARARCCPWFPFGCGPSTDRRHGLIAAVRLGLLLVPLPTGRMLAPGA